MNREHGTVTGYNQHKYRGEAACWECATAYNFTRGWRRFVRGLQHHPPYCHHCGSVFPDHTCHLARTR